MCASRAVDRELDFLTQGKIFFEGAGYAKMVSSALIRALEDPTICQLGSQLVLFSCKAEFKHFQHSSC